MVLIEIFLRVVLYPATAGSLWVAKCFMLAGNGDGARRWIGVWYFVHAPIDAWARVANYSYRRPAFPFELQLARFLWRFWWYRQFISYCAANPFPFSQRPWPSFIQNGSPCYAVEYYWFLYVAQDWASAQHALADARLCGWPVEFFSVPRDQWKGET